MISMLVKVFEVIKANKDNLIHEDTEYINGIKIITYRLINEPITIELKYDIYNCLSKVSVFKADNF